MASPEAPDPAESPLKGEVITTGVTKVHLDPSTFPPLAESNPPRELGEPVADKGVLDIETWDEFFREKFGEQEGLGELKWAWVVDYKAGDVFPTHSDFIAPVRRKVILATVEGQADMFFPDVEDPVGVGPGDVIVLDCKDNPPHAITAITDRRVVLATYKY